MKNGSPFQLSVCYSLTFTRVGPSFPIVGDWLRILTEDKLKNGSPFQLSLCHSHPSDDSGLSPIIKSAILEGVSDRAPSTSTVCVRRTI